MLKQTLHRLNRKWLNFSYARKGHLTFCLGSKNIYVKILLRKLTGFWTIVIFFCFKLVTLEDFLACRVKLIVFSQIFYYLKNLNNFCTPYNYLPDTCNIILAKSHDNYLSLDDSSPTIIHGSLLW